MSRIMPETPHYLRASTTGRPVGVDRNNNMLLGYVVAQLGPFKSDGRGEFDLDSLRDIVRIGNASPKGLKSRFTHPDMSSDGLGKHLGRATHFSLGTAKDERTGKMVAAVRADLTFNKTALEPPPDGGGKPYGTYIMDLAESDPDAISSSLVVTGLDFFVNNKGKLEKVSREEIGPDETPIWRPTALSASDIVDTGDAVDGLLSVETQGLPLSELWKGADMLDRIFDGQPRDVIQQRCIGFLNRYLSRKFGETQPLETPTLDKYRKALLRMESVVK